MNTASNTDTEPATPEARRSPLLMWLLFAGMLVVLATVLLEVALRVATTPFQKLGLRQVIGIPLVPFITDEQLCREAHTLALSGEYVVVDDTLGWTIKASGVGGAGNYHSNSQGVRTLPDRIFSETVPEGKYRIVSVGDSFMHGDDIPFEDTWAWHLEVLAENVEVINLGVPGYGTDQAFLRWRKDGTKFQSHLAILGIWPENICRNLNMNRFYLTRASHLPKPLFRLNGETIVLARDSMENVQDIVIALSNPMDTEYYREDFWYRPYELRDHVYYGSRFIQTMVSAYAKLSRKQEREKLYTGTNPVGIDITVAIAKAFHAEALEHGSHPLILIFPMVDMLDIYPDEDSLPLVPALKAQGLEVLNLFPRFSGTAYRNSDGHGYFLPGGHLNRHGNLAVAEELQAYIASRRGPIQD